MSTELSATPSARAFEGLKPPTLAMEANEDIGMSVSSLVIAAKTLPEDTSQTSGPELTMVQPTDFIFANTKRSVTSSTIRELYLRSLLRVLIIAYVS